MRVPLGRMAAADRTTMSAHPMAKQAITAHICLKCADRTPSTTVPQHRPSHQRSQDMDSARSQTRLSLLGQRGAQTSTAAQDRKRKLVKTRAGNTVSCLSACKQDVKLGAQSPQASFVQTVGHSPCFATPSIAPLSSVNRPSQQPTGAS